jgi:hypothetical protein
MRERDTTLQRRTCDTHVDRSLDSQSHDTWLPDQGVLGQRGDGGVDPISHLCESASHGHVNTGHMNTR